MSGPNIQAGGWEIGVAPRASLALTLAATALLHIYVENRPADSQAHGWRVFVENTYKEGNIDHGAPPIGPGHPGTIEVTRPVPGEIETKQFDTYHIAVTPYARGFDNDPAVEIVDEDAVGTLESLASQLKADGWGNITFKVQGVASAEDATRDGIAGVTTRSDDNTRTANARGAALYQHLKDDANLPDVTIEQLPGVEGELSEPQVELLKSYAEQFGYQPRGDMSGVEVMIDQWNLDPQSVPPEVDADLQLLLGNLNRGDLVMVYASRQVPGQETTKTESELVCIVPVQRVETHYEVPGRPWKATIPWFIPIPVPYVRRRKKDKDDVFMPPYLTSIAGGTVPSGPSLPSRTARTATSTAGGAPRGVVRPTPVPPQPKISSEPLSPRPPLRPVPNSAPNPLIDRFERRLLVGGVGVILAIIAGGIALGECIKPEKVAINTPTLTPSDSCANLRTVEQPTDKTKVVIVRNGRVVSTEYRQP